MGSKRLVGLALAMAMIVAGLIAPAAHAADFDVMTARYIVPTRHGDIHLVVSHPARDGTIKSGPVVLTYTPYSVDGTSVGTDQFPAATHVPDGYVRAYADVIGTGNSGGCWDYGGKKEQQSAYDLVEWIAKQKWSTGKVAMIGGSYEGTTANMAAVARPPHLTTVVPIAAIAHWYGYAYAGGIRYSLNNEFLGHEGPAAAADEGLDTPLGFDFGFSIPPPVDPQDEDWAARVQSRINPCDRAEHTQHGYDDTPDYDAFWKERDYLKDASKVTIPVLVAHNWGDWNVKQDEGWEFFRALKNSKKAVMFFGSRWNRHGAPGSSSESAPEASKKARAAFDQTVRRWFDHYLMGKDNGVDELPAVITQTADSEGPGKLLYGKPKTTDVDLIAQLYPLTGPGQYAWQLLPHKPLSAGFGPQADRAATSFPITSSNSESHASHHGQQNHEWFWLESPPFKKDTRIFGEIKVQIYSSVEREWVTFTPSVFDVDPADHIVQNGQHVGAKDPKAVVAITRGFLDTRYRNGLDKQVVVESGKPFEVTVETHPIDYVIKKGHYIGLNLQSEIIEWMLPKPYPGCDAVPDPQNENGCPYVKIFLDEARTRLIVPIVNAPKDAGSLFGGHQH